MAGRGGWGFSPDLVIATCLVLGIVWPGGAARAQISPGKLARAHEKLEGPLNCLKCHGGKGQEMDQSCLSCHKPIAELEKLNEGLHARVKGEKCASCHPDHAGPDFHLITWDGGAPEKFDHVKSGWPLEGRHAATACRDCHKPANQNSPVAVMVSTDRKTKTWLGLDPQCRSCHEDRHRGTLDANCASCHTTTAWKGATLFDHARSTFPLTGKHREVECARCHKSVAAAVAAAPAGAQPDLLFKPLLHNECSDCHADPHAGKLGPRCSTCHSTDSFRKVDAASFNHDRTQFPLRGKHTSLECAQCHDPKKGSAQKLAFGRCSDCHADAHAGKALLQGQIADCASCHNVQGWRHSTFSVTDHETVAFALSGKHQEVPCASCHTKSATMAGVKNPLGTAGVQLHPASKACADCHPPAHAQQFVARPDRGACESCHNTAGWKPSLFAAPRHATAGFPLEGRHAEVPCADCHGPTRTALPPLPGPEVVGKAGVMLALGSVDCAACHQDAHRARFKEAGGAAELCSDCHNAVDFRPSTIDVAAHARFSFPLEGAHQAIPCADCHQELKQPRAVSTLVRAKAVVHELPFTQDRRACRDCHKDPHGGQFVDAGDCSRCHGPDSFQPAVKFDHNRDAAFSLKGAHEKVACDNCHRSRLVDGNRFMVVYKPLDSKCESCHAGKGAGK